MNATIRNFDVVHLHSVFLYPTWAAARAAANAKIPYVLSPRGMLVRDLIRRRSALVKLSWISLIERATLAGASRIHLTSEVERRELIGLGLALAPTIVISNGVDAPASFSSGDVSEDVRALIASGYDILSFGRINWKKGLDELIRAIAPLHSVKLLIAGNDESKFVTKLRSIASEFGVRDRVYFLSRQIVGADKEALFSAARLFVLPSLSENFGNVVTEAMIRSVPVVVSEHVGAAEIVAASGGGVVVPNVEADLTDAIGCLLKSSKRLADAGSAGAAYARDKLTWQSVAGHFEQMYREVLKRKLTDQVLSA
jgi:glycosyltransferase involved in cell wall biosynthesis